MTPHISEFGSAVWRERACDVLLGNLKRRETGKEDVQSCRSGKGAIEHLLWGAPTWGEF
jgi:hypothetical protein